MTASAISQAIRKLENYYGVKLFNRTTRSPHADSISRPLAQWQTLICASPDHLHKLPTRTLTPPPRIAPNQQKYALY